MSKVIISSWLSLASLGSLGFYRGTKHYGRDYKRECIRYEERKDNKYYIGTIQKPQYLYIHCISWGLFGLLIYANPITVVAALPKELYRLEVNIRGLNEEKEKDEYHDFF